MLVGDAKQRLADLRARHGNHLGPKLTGERQIAIQLRLLLLIQCNAGIDVGDDPRSIHRGCSPSGITNQLLGGRPAPHRDEQPFAAFPRTGNPLFLHDVAQIAIDMLGHNPKRHFSQGREIALTKEVLRRGRCPLAEIDFAFCESGSQLFRRQVDEDELVCQVEEGIRDGFPNEYTCDLMDGVAPAFNVLDVNGGENVNPGLE
jgi:hypothetical protein